MKLAMAVAAVALAAAACGGDGKNTKCAEGTFKSGHRCFPYDPNDETAPVTTANPPSGMLPAGGSVTLTTDEPANIYYTTDGSAPTTSSASEPGQVVVSGVDEATTIRFFAVDPAGNEEAEKQVAYASVGPSVSDLAVSFTADDATITWTNPADPDFAGVVVGRVIGPIASPVAGTAYQVNDLIGTGVEVIYVGTGTSTTDSDRVVGVHRYLAWGFNDAQVYGRTRGAHASLALPVQTATLTVNVAANTVTVTTPPSVLQISGTSAYDAGGSILTLSLTVTNTIARVIPNAKVRVSSASTGVFTNNEGLLDGLPYKYFGPEAMASGASETRDLTFGTVGAADMVVLTLEIMESPYLVSSYGNGGNVLSYPLWDWSTGRRVASMTSLDSMRGFSGSAVARDGFFTPDGRYLYLAARAAPRISVIDMTTLLEVGGITLASDGRSHTGSIVTDAGKTEAYVSLTSGGHTGGADLHIQGTGETDLYAVRLDLASLEETGRVFLATKSIGRARGLSVSPDGTTLAIGTYDGETNDDADVHFVDVATWSEIDTDSTTAGVQPVDLTAVSGSAPGSLLYTDNAHVVVAPSGEGTTNNLADIDTADFSAISVVTTSGRASNITKANGKYLLGGPLSPFFAYETGGTRIGFPSSLAARAVVQGAAGTLAALQTSGPSELDPVSGATVRTFEVGAESIYYNHFLLLSP